MTQEKREKLIEFIKTNDSTYNYNTVNFKYYSDEDLLVLKKRLDREIEYTTRGKREDSGIVISGKIKKNWKRKN